jgi:TonB family protein
MNQRKKRNSSKINLTISVVFHSALVLAIIFLAAREGMLGKKLKEITVTMAPKEKKPEAPKEKPPEPKLEPPKPAETPKVAAVAPPPAEIAAPPPPVAEVPSAAPAPVSLPAFEFNDGARDVQSVSDPNLIYKGLVEHALRSRWNRPEDIADDKYVAEVEVSIDAQGKVTGARWLKGSGDARWDSSVKAALAATKMIARPPPKGFPGTFLTRFDVESTRTEEVMRLSSR